MSYNLSQPQFALSCDIGAAFPSFDDTIIVGGQTFTYKAGLLATVEINSAGTFYSYIDYSSSSGTASTQVSYGIADVRVGDWIGDRVGGGAAYQILHIKSTPDSGYIATFIAADIDGYSVTSVDGYIGLNSGSACIFRVNEDSIPMLATTSAKYFLNGVNSPVFWVSDMIARFALRNNKTQYVTVYQTDRTTVTGASTSDDNTDYVVASTTGFTVGNTVIIEGIEVEAPSAGYNGTGTIQTIISNVITVKIKSDGTPTSFTGATLRIGSISRGRDFIVGESVYIDSTGIFRKSAGSVKISDTVGIVTSKGIPFDDWFSFRPSGKYFDKSLVPNDFFPKSENIVNGVPLTPGLKLYINPNGATPQYTSVAPTSNPYATWIMISATRAIYIAGSGGGGGSSTAVVTGTVQVFDGGNPTWVSDPLTTIYPVLDCGGIL